MTKEQDIFLKEIEIGHKYIKDQLSSVSESLDHMNAIWHDHHMQLVRNNLEINNLTKKIKDLEFLLSKSGFKAFIKDNWWKIGGFFLTWIIIIEKFHS